MDYDRMANEKRPNWFEVMCEKNHNMKLRCFKNGEWKNRFVVLCLRQWTLFAFRSNRCELWKVRNVLRYDVSTNDHKKVYSSFFLQSFRLDRTVNSWRQVQLHKDIVTKNENKMKKRTLVWRHPASHRLEYDTKFYGSAAEYFSAHTTKSSSYSSYHSILHQNLN